jgi:hypothetical protein
MKDKKKGDVWLSERDGKKIKNTVKDITVLENGFTVIAIEQVEEEEKGEEKGDKK